ncbi:threonine synthase [Companilactobacillus farciminis]|nr:threonine synthase [Companilactobacillus farciminis]
MQAIHEKTNLPIPKNLAEVWNLPVLHDDVIDKDKMEDYIQQKVEADFYDKN